jgi:hypothetical protein
MLGAVQVPPAPGLRPGQGRPKRVCAAKSRSYPMLLGESSTVPAARKAAASCPTPRKRPLVRVGSRKVMAARVVKAAAIGRPIEADEDVHHECRVARCVNPDHLVVHSAVDHQAHHAAELRQERCSVHNRPYDRRDAKGRAICLLCRRDATRAMPLALRVRHGPVRVTPPPRPRLRRLWPRCGHESRRRTHVRHRRPSDQAISCAAQRPAAIPVTSPSRGHRLCRAAASRRGRCGPPSPPPVPSGRCGSCRTRRRFR